MQLCAFDSAMEALSHKQPDPLITENFYNLMNSIEGRFAGVVVRPHSAVTGRAFSRSMHDKLEGVASSTQGPSGNALFTASTCSFIC